MNKNNVIKSKLKLLKKNRTLNPHPEKVKDPLFREDEFFDPNDMMQVKYEMIRKVQQEGSNVTQAAADFGFSRISFYKALRAFKERGIPGLHSSKRGPHEGYKLKDSIVKYIQEQYKENPKIQVKSLVEEVKKKFDIIVHKRSIERALVKIKKKRR